MPEKIVQIQSTITLMADTEVLSYLSNEEYSRIKEIDKTPVFAALSIGYEGESTGELYNAISTGERLKEWFKQVWPLRAVKQLAGFLKEKRDVQVYLSHDLKNRMRVSVGNVIDGTKKQIKGVTHAVAIAYIHNQKVREQLASGELDTCSLEATCLFERAETGLKWIVSEVRDLSGIVLMNSKENAPGFKDASVLGVIAAMSAEENTEKRKVAKVMTETVISLKEVKEYIRDNGINPDMLFTVQDLTKVESVKGAFKSEYQEKLDALTKEKSELEAEIKPLRRLNSQQALSKKIRECELLKNETKETVDYLSKIVNVELAGDDKDIEVVKTAVEQQLELMKAAGIKVGVKKVDDSKTKPGDKKEEENQEEDDTNKEDMTVGKNNPLIP